MTSDTDVFCVETDDIDEMICNPFTRCAGPREHHQQRWQKLIQRWSSAEMSLRSADYPQGHDGAGEPRRERGELSADSLNKYSVAVLILAAAATPA